MTGAAEVSSEPGLGTGSSELGSETPYPLLLPKGVVLKLKPVANCFSRKAWRQKRPSVLKPLLIRPSPSLQPGSTPGKTPARSTPPEAPPSKMVVRIPHVIQPAAVVQTVPGVPPPGAPGGDSFESPTALPSTTLEARTGFPLSEPQTALPSAPVPKVMLPSLAPSKFRKPCARPRASKRKGAKASLCLEPASLIHPVPVIFTVPAATVKVVSLGSGCNVIQPVSAAVAQSPQAIPITTLLVNPTSFPCPLSQPLVASSLPPLIVSGNSVSLPVPPAPEDKAPVSVDISCPLAEGKNAFQGLEPKLEPQELSPLCTPVFPKEEHSPGPPAADRVCQEELSENSACGWTLVKAEDGGQGLEPPLGSRESLSTPPRDLEDVVKMEPKDPGEDACEDSRAGCSVGLDTGFPGEEPRRPPVLQQEEEEGSQPARTSSASREPRDEGHLGAVSKGSPRTASSCADPDAARSSPPGKSEGFASADRQAAGTPAGPEAGAEKDGPEEEEEEDFDDLTQDEEDEMSSASEESVLSVPELQVRARECSHVFCGLSHLPDLRIGHLLACCL